MSTYYTQVTVLRVRDTKMDEDNVTVRWERQAHIPRNATSSVQNATGAQKTETLPRQGDFYIVQDHVTRSNTG